MPRLVLPLAFGIVGTAILLSLGAWQVQRLAWKEAVLAQIDSRIADDPVPLPADPAPDAHGFLAVKTRGTITGDELHVLASTRDLGAVYRVIAAFETEDGRRIMVDRGVIPTEEKNAPRAPVDVTLTGNLHWPEETDSFTPEADPEANIWFARDVPAMARALETEPVLIVVRETSQSDPAVTPLPVSSAGIPNDHLEYAVTWFGLAAVWVLMTVFYLRLMRSQTRKG
ncbi:surfeit locus 1 family protein [Salinihabitans flavidus]|uniref:SURF1-like protein n=1 Tax=Salinihabitans flavidus TaxID=569882 RepID=A0A1H8U097_9RHOB|nr:surfeit locus 1 family protein [Salinihabitans flavidus]